MSPKRGQSSLATHSIYIAPLASIIYSVLEAPVVQWIEPARPKGKMGVRFFPGAQRSETRPRGLMLIFLKAGKSRPDWGLFSKSSIPRGGHCNRLAVPAVIHRSGFSFSPEGVW